ncbi:hypothetical protein FF1_001712 [Malus domestica]
MLLTELLGPVLHLPRLPSQLVTSRVQLVRARRLLPGHLSVDPCQHRHRSHTKPTGCQEPHYYEGKGDHGWDKNRAEYDQQGGGYGQSYDCASKDQPRGH